MLKEQAISLLTQVKKNILESEPWLYSIHQPIEEAFSMAIEAIKSMQHNTPNTLNALDTIYRQAAIDAINHICPVDTEYDCTLLDRVDVRCVLSDLPSAQPDLDEWCTDCKEYDSEKHCCPRFNRVIKNALKDARPEIIRCGKCKHRDKRYLCDVWDEYISNEDFYCGCAERKEG